VTGLMPTAKLFDLFSRCAPTGSVHASFLAKTDYTLGGNTKNASTTPPMDWGTPDNGRVQ